MKKQIRPLSKIDLTFLLQKSEGLTQDVGRAATPRAPSQKDQRGGGGWYH